MKLSKLRFLKVGLVIVDSIAMPFRGETDYTKSAITLLSSVLSRIAVSFNCLVIFFAFYFFQKMC